MKTAIRFVIQFLAGIGMLVVSDRAYFLIWEFYARGLPRPYEAEEFVSNRTLAVLLVLFLIFQAFAYLGMKTVLKRPDKEQIL